MWKTICAIVILFGSAAAAQEKSFTLQTPDALAETGFLQHLLPRFSLKTGIRITPSVEDGEAAFGDAGVPVFRQGEKVWHLSKSDGPYTDAFEEWLLSDVGKRTIEAFAPGGTPVFSADVTVREITVAAEITGDVVMGEEMSLTHCGRCHVVNETNRMNAIGSTPSFGLMRNFPDWEGRFLAFYALKPHPAFTQITDVTDPFPKNLPSPIAPIEVTLDQLDAIVAYVATIAPSDLGAPVQSQ
ncbi:hypothetical protein GV827_13220 [Sulfitobacter sp. JBTF-M27]|uniref:Cytochrome c domain-containing protein n=1 Tax=Sulfitobacter sediminilitoris TaxID=2698830 RepID=A0A6P0CB43_9RHOB|nr:cytochrome c [Sulfitobacter sediminilitoris]NEK23362.1 hypothetical protein [Sulfitobacter sediminilitoris]